MDTIEWKELVIPIFPWDNEATIRHRISATPRFIVLQEDWKAMLASRVKETTVHYRDLREWLQGVNLREIIATDDLLGLYLYLRMETEQLTKEDWKLLSKSDLLPRTSLFYDMPYESLVQRLQAEMMEDDAAKKRAEELLSVFTQVEEAEVRPHTRWSIDHHRIRYILKDDRYLGRIFNEMQLPMPWIMGVFYQQYYSWGVHTNIFCRVRRDLMLDMELYNSIKNEVVEGNTLYLFYPGLTNPVIVRNEDDHHILLEIDNSDLLEEALSMLDIASSRIITKDDIGMVGSILFRDEYIDLALFQDACMNDPVISHFFYMNELKRQSSEKSLMIRFTAALREALEISFPETETPDMMIQNYHRTTGYEVQVVLKTPISEKNMELFFFLLERLMGYYHAHRQEWLTEYSQYIPDMAETLEKRKKMLVRKEVRSDRTSYVTKYPGMFVPALYKVLCQNKLQPELLTEEEVGKYPAERVMKYPVEKIGIFEPEHYYCPNDDYPHPGLRKLDITGANTLINFAPCCFKSNQKKENDVNMKRVRLYTEEERYNAAVAAASLVGGNIANESIIKNAAPIEGKMIMKEEGQLGYIDPPNINRILLAVDPFCEYFRIGVAQSPASLLSCMLMRKILHNQNARISMIDLRRKIADHPGCAEACLEENPYLSLEQIRHDLANILVYFDPRRFYRAVEVFFGIHLVIFTKPQEIKPLKRDADLMEFIGPRTPYSPSFPKKKIVIVYEHWGGKTNILSKLPYPHCELIVYRSFTETKIRVDLEATSVFKILDGVRLWFDGTTRICPMDATDGWVFKHVVGQVVDRLGKVRMLLMDIENEREEEYEGGGVEETKSNRRDPTAKKTIVRVVVDPPLPILEEIPMIQYDDEKTLSKSREAMEATAIIPFLQRFSSWKSGIQLRSAEDKSILWKVSQSIYSRLLGANVSHVFTFHVILPQPRPDEIMKRSALLQQLIKIDKNDPRRTFLEETQVGIREMHMVRLEKTARCLQDLSLNLFSIFLEKNQLVPGGIDPDEILSRFRTQHVQIDKAHIEKVVITDEKSVEQLVRKDRVLLPSVRFWEKIRYRIKWILFNNPSFFIEKSPLQLPSFYRRITDFFFQKETFLCHLNQLGSLMQNTIYDHYPLLDLPLDEIDNTMTSTTPTLWYHPDQSPLAHPALLYSFPDLEARRVFVAGVATEGFGNHNVHEWSHNLKKWQPVQASTSSSALSYFLASGKDNLALLLR